MCVRVFVLYFTSRLSHTQLHTLNINSDGGIFWCVDDLFILDAKVEKKNSVKKSRFLLCVVKAKCYLCRVCHWPIMRVCLCEYTLEYSFHILYLFAFEFPSDSVAKLHSPLHMNSGPESNTCFVYFPWGMYATCCC